jgi:hypothetical protein
MLVSADEFIQYVKEYDFNKSDLEVIFIEYNNSFKLLPPQPFKTYVVFEEEIEKIRFLRIPADADPTEEFSNVHTSYLDMQALIFH